VCLDALLMYVNHMVDRLHPEVFDNLNILKYSSFHILNIELKVPFYLNRKMTLNHLHADYLGIK
jgi:hypothetical protein